MSLDSAQNTVEGQILAARTELLYVNGKTSGLVVIFASTVLAVILYGHVDTAQILPWYLSITVVAALRLGLLRLRRLSTNRTPQDWIKRYTAATLLVGLC